MDIYRLFYLIGNSYQIKSPPGRIALRRIGIMSQKRPTAGGESCEQDSFLSDERNVCCGHGVWMRASVRYFFGEMPLILWNALEK